MKHMKNRERLLMLIDTALLAALACVAATIIKIPTPTNGYVHLGDALVLLAGWLLGPFYGFFAAAIGSLFADLFSGYVPYAPATFLIKGFTAFAAYAMTHFFVRVFKKQSVLPYIFGGTVGECLMVVGYYLYEAIVLGYGFAAALLGVLGNLMQGLAGIMIGTLLIVLFRKSEGMSHLMEKHGLIRKE